MHDLDATRNEYMEILGPLLVISIVVDGIIGAICMGVFGIPQEFLWAYVPFSVSLFFTLSTCVYLTQEYNGVRMIDVFPKSRTLKMLLRSIFWPYVVFEFLKFLTQEFCKPFVEVYHGLFDEKKPEIDMDDLSKKGNVEFDALEVKNTEFQFEYPDFKEN